MSYLLKDDVINNNFSWNDERWLIIQIIFRTYYTKKYTIHIYNQYFDEFIVEYI